MDLLEKKNNVSAGAYFQRFELPNFSSKQILIEKQNNTVSYKKHSWDKHTPPIIGKLYVIKVYLPSRRKKDLFLYNGSVADIVWTTKESFPEYI